MAVTPDGTRAVVAGNEFGSVTVLDAATGEVLDTVTVGAGPVGVAVTADGTRAVVANSDAGSVSVIDTGLRVG